MQNNGKKIIPDAPLLPFHIEIDKTVRGFSLSCSGVKGISEFSDSMIKLRLPSFFLQISGKDLYMTVFEGKCVEIIGRLSEVRFIYGKT